MRSVLSKLFLFVFLVGLIGCAHQSQNTYNYDEVGKSSAVSFGTIIAVRQVDIMGENTGVGALAGSAAGAGIGSQIGKGSGNAAAVIGIAVAGAIAGAVAEQAISDRKGIEYVVTLQTGLTLTIVQEMVKDERVFAIGDRVMVQNSAGYQRVLAADHLPTEIKRPKGIRVVD